MSVTFWQPALRRIERLRHADNFPRETTILLAAHHFPK